MKKKILANKSPLLSYLGHQADKLLHTTSKNLKNDTHCINIPTERSSSFKIFCVSKITLTPPDKFTSEEVEKTYIQNILVTVTEHIMVIFYWWL